MRVWIGLIVVGSVACHKKPASPAGGGAAQTTAVTPPAVTTPPLPTFCITDEDGDTPFVVAASDDRSATICFGGEDTPKKCAALTFSIGTFASVAPPPRAAVTSPPRVDTTKLALPKGHDYQAVLSPDGKTIAAVSGDLEGQLFVVDAPTGKLRKRVTWEADGGCMESPSFIGDNIYVQYNVCAGPGATGWIVSPDGKKLGSVERVNPTGVFFPVGGTRYAFEDFAGSGIEIVDGKTGKSIQEIAIAAPEDCADCPSLRTGNLGLTRLPGGKLVQFATVISVVDPGAMKIEKTMKWPLCAKTSE